MQRNAYSDILSIYFQIMSSPSWGPRQMRHQRVKLQEY